MTNNYQAGLVKAYEDEVNGMAYFKSLANHFTKPQQHKLLTLALLERQTANALLPLIRAHQLTTKDGDTLKRQGILDAQQEDHSSWQALMTGFVEQLPAYLEDFETLFKEAPAHDKPALKQLLRHEQVIIDFARKELTGDSEHSLDLVNQHLQENTR